MVRLGNDIYVAEILYINRRTKLHVYKEDLKEWIKFEFDIRVAWHQMISVTLHGRITFWVYEYPFNEDGNNASHPLRLYSLANNVLTQSDQLSFSSAHLIPPTKLTCDSEGRVFFTVARPEYDTIYVWSDDGYYKGQTHNSDVSRAAAMVFDKKRDLFYITNSIFNDLIS
jgi:hypothetical protein